MKELQICLENCDVIKVPWESVVNLSIYKVHKTYHFAKNMNLEMLVADDILLTLSKSAGVVIEGCSSEEKVVVVPKEINGKPVLAIGERGLANMQNCEAVVLPDTVRVISKSAFTVDKVMKFVYLGTSLKKIDDLAFNGCSKLEFVEFPEGLESIGKLTFSHNVVIKYIKIPASVTEITDVFYFPENSNKNVEIHTPKGSKAEEVANHLELKVVND